MSSGKDDPPQRAGQTFVFDFSKDEAPGPKIPSDSAAAPDARADAEPFTIPSFLRTGPAKAQRRAEAAAGRMKTPWRDEDFARIAQTAKPEPAGKSRERIEPTFRSEPQQQRSQTQKASEKSPNKEPDIETTPSMEPATSTAAAHRSTGPSTPLELPSAEARLEEDLPQASRAMETKAPVVPDQMVSAEPEAEELAQAPEPLEPEPLEPEPLAPEPLAPEPLTPEPEMSAIAAPQSDLSETPRISIAPEVRIEPQPPEAPIEQTPVQVPEEPTILIRTPSNETSRFRRRAHKGRRAEMPSKPLAPIVVPAPDRHADVQASNFERSSSSDRPSTFDEERREPLWSGPRFADERRFADEARTEGWRRLDVPSAVEDDEAEYSIPAGVIWERQERSRPSVAWFLLLAVIAAGGYGAIHAWRAASSDANKLAMLAPKDTLSPAETAPLPSSAPTDTHTSPAPVQALPSKAVEKAPQKSNEEALVPQPHAKPPAQYVEKRRVAPTPSLKPEEDESSRVAMLAPGPHPLTAPPSAYEATHENAMLSDLATDVQKKLILLGYPSVPHTGTLDAATRQAVRLFQTNSGLPATGEIDSATLDRLNSVP